MWWIHWLDALFRDSSVKSVSSRLTISFSFFLSLFFLIPSACATSYSSWQTDYELLFRLRAAGLIASATGFMPAADIVCRFASSQVAQWIFFRRNCAKSLAVAHDKMRIMRFFPSFFFFSSSALRALAGAHTCWLHKPSERAAGRAKCDGRWARAPINRVF